jgi:hemolysin D
MLKVLSFFDLFGRYGRAFGHSWARRKELETLGFQRDEAEFLPDALALQESPVSPIPRLAASLIVVFCIIAVIWAIVGSIDVVAIARGKVIPNDRLKTIQPFETAIVKKVFVSDGKQVKAGDILIELDPSIANADQARVSIDVFASTLQVARAKALLAALDGNFAPSLPKPAKLTEQEERRFAEGQAAVNSQYADVRAKLNKLDAEISRRRAEIASNTESIKKLAGSLVITRKQAADFKALIKEGFVSNHALMEKEQKVVEQEGDLANQTARQKELESGLAENIAQKASYSSEQRRLGFELIADAQQKLSAQNTEMTKAQVKVKQLELRSPVDGTVQQLAVFTEGGVVTPAQPLMTIVPKDSAVEIEAFLENKDIGFVRTGQVAEIKLEAFPFTKYGTVPGSVTSISRDAITDEKKGLLYAVRIKLDKTSIQVEDSSIGISAGMASTVEIKTGKRKLIEYFLSPLLQYKSESFKER